MGGNLRRAVEAGGWGRRPGGRSLRYGGRGSGCRDREKQSQRVKDGWAIGERSGGEGKQRYITQLEQVDRKG